MLRLADPNSYLNALAPPPDPSQPPPTLVSSAQNNPAISKHLHPRLSASWMTTAWAIGDVAKVIIEGKERQVIFVYKQKYGLGTSHYLVMVDLCTWLEIFAPNGETELALPPYSPLSLVAHGPTDIIQIAHLKVLGHQDPPHLNVVDLMQLELAGYVAQFMDFLEEDDNLNVLEKRGFKPPQVFLSMSTRPVPEPPAAPQEHKGVASNSQLRDTVLTPTSAWLQISASTDGIGMSDTVVLWLARSV